MYPLDLEIEKVQSILGECNRILLYTSKGRKIFEFNDYESYVDFELLKQIIDEINNYNDPDIFKKFDETYKYLYEQESRDIDNAIATMKNMKGRDKELKEKYKDYISE